MEEMALLLSNIGAQNFLCRQPSKFSCSHLHVVCSLSAGLVMLCTWSWATRLYWELNFLLPC